jgi:alanine racemase
VLTIDLDAIAANWRHLQSLAPASEVGAVVKADAYGLGADVVGPALQKAGARTFFVARLDEALALRRVLPQARLFVLDGLALGGAASFAAEGVAPVLNQPAELEAWRAQAVALGRRLEAALHVDTGMSRLGFSPRQMEGVDADALGPIELAFVMSHLACADEPAHEMNLLQLERFEAVRPRLAGVRASLANSAGIFLGRAYQFDLCRPGIALWGANPTPGRPNPMQPVVRLSAPVLQVHEVDARGTVGYGATRSVPAGSRLATVPLGYADGIVRAAGGMAKASIAGREVAIAGRISMDLITLDVTDVPAAEVPPGGSVDLIWGADGLDRLAAAAGTIPYEILTRLGGRLERRYLGTGAGA